MYKDRRIDNCWIDIFRTERRYKQTDLNVMGSVWSESEGGGENECCICLADFKDKVKLKQCGHMFCKMCVEKYLEIRHKCPICRGDASLNDVEGVGDLDKSLYNTTFDKINTIVDKIQDNVRHFYYNVRHEQLLPEYISYLFVLLCAIVKNNIIYWVIAVLMAIHLFVMVVSPPSPLDYGMKYSDYLMLFGGVALLETIISVMFNLKTDIILNGIICVSTFVNAYMFIRFIDRR